MLNFFKKKENKEKLDKGLEKTKEGFFSRLGKAVMGKSKVDDEVLDQLEDVLIASDVGVKTTIKLIERIEKRVAEDKYTSSKELDFILRDEIQQLILESQGEAKGGFEIPELSHEGKKVPYVVMVVGVNGVGKTTTTKLLLAQIAAQGGHIALCDPHGQHDQGLLTQCHPISGACIRQAVAPDEISEAILFVDKIGSQRTRQGRGGTPVVLVVDEFTALVIRQALPDDILLRLTAMAVEYAKFNLHILLIAHDWSKAALGSLGTPLRRAITHRIIHRSDMQNAEFLLPNAGLARQVPTLTTGQALSWSDTGPVTLAVPLVDDATLRAAARGKPPQPYVPGAKLHLLAQATPPAPVAAPVLTHEDRIIALLRDQPGLQLGEIVAALPIDKQVLQNALTRLAREGRVQRDGTPYRYQAAPPGATT